MLLVEFSAPPTLLLAVFPEFRLRLYTKKPPAISPTTAAPPHAPAMIAILLLSPEDFLAP